MIDTIKVEMTTNTLGHLDKYYQSQRTTKLGFTYRSYKIRNISVRSTQLGDDFFKISITGSLSKFLYGTNLVRFTRLDVNKSIFELGELIGFDISLAVIKNIDIACNIVLKYPPKAYTMLLGYKSRYKRTSIRDAETVYFEIGKIVLAFYDKRKEFIKKNSRYPELKNQFASLLKDINLIRYELRLKNLLETLNLSSHLTLGQLYHPTIYRKLIMMWYKHYKLIQKDRIGGFSSFKKFPDYLIYEGISALGGISKCLEVLNAWAGCNGYDDQKKGRARKKLLDVNKTLRTYSLIKELDKKIKIEKEFYL